MIWNLKETESNKVLILTNLPLKQAFNWHIFGLNLDFIITGIEWIKEKKGVEFMDSVASSLHWASRSSYPSSEHLCVQKQIKDPLNTFHREFHLPNELLPAH